MAEEIPSEVPLDVKQCTPGEKDDPAGSAAAEKEVAEPPPSPSSGPLPPPTIVIDPPRFPPPDSESAGEEDYEREVSFEVATQEGSEFARAGTKRFRHVVFEADLPKAYHAGGY